MLKAAYVLNTYWKLIRITPHFIKSSFVIIIQQTCIFKHDSNNTKQFTQHQVQKYFKLLFQRNLGLLL